MGVQKKTRKFAEVKRVIGKRDARRKENIKKTEEAIAAKKKNGPDGELVREIPQMPSHMWGTANEALTGGPFSILLDTSFINRSVQMKLPLLETFMDTLFSTCNLIITDCVMAELEKLGPKYRIARQVAKDERWERMKCQHKGVYADDCIVNKVRENSVYLVATQDKELQRRLRRIPGVPILKVGRGKYFVERLPGALD